ncbi:MAG: ABC transporter ATP-binding protein [Haloechinothrix sp.]
MSTPVLEVTSVRKSFRRQGASRPHVAVDDVSFQIPRGGSLGLVGESGSGKSTLARLVVGLLRPDSGSISVNGHPRDRRVRGRAHRLRRAAQAQLVFQDPYGSLDPRLTVQATLDSALKLHGVADRARRRARVTELLGQVGLGTREAGARPRQLSGGQRQRVAIARALAVRPELLVLDEAVSALDVSIQSQILELLMRINSESGVALLFVSHDLAVINHVTDTLVLYRGRVVEHGPTAQVLHNPQHVYTQLLLSSIPQHGWDLDRVVALRRELQAAQPE